MPVKKVNVQNGKTYTLKDVHGTYTLVVGELSEGNTSSFSETSSSNLHVGIGIPSISLGKAGSIYLDSLNKRIYVKDAIGWDSGCDISGSGNGSSGVNGRTTLEGSGPPSDAVVYAAALADAGISASDVQNGDLYLDTLNHIFYKRTSGSWVSRTSHKGKNGRTIFEGSGDPDDPNSTLPTDIGDAVEGDLYHDIVNFKWHHRNSSGIPGVRWDARSTYLGPIGPTGLKGQNGNDGRTTLEGNGPPSDPTAYAAALADAGISESDIKNGDLYLDTLNHIFYKRAADAWNSRTSHKGKNGRTIFDGSGDPDDPASELPSDISDAAVGDLYHDVTNFKWYKRNSSGIPGDRWDCRSTYLGPIGPSGLNGQNGQDGRNGNDGRTTIEGNGAPSDPTVYSAALADAGISDSDVKNGDLYLDTLNHIFYKRTSGAWVSRTSHKGRNGKTVFDGSGDPDDPASELPSDISDAAVGDLYHDVTNFKWYKRNSSGIPGSRWDPRNSYKSSELKNISLTTGVNLASLSSSEWSSNAILAAAREGDTVVDSNNKRMYKRTSSGWEDQGSVKGEKGIDGANGLRGKITLEGSGAPGTGTNLATPTSALTDALTDAGITSGDLDVGDIYLDTSNHRFYKKTSLGWVARGATFVGPAGSIGPQGLKGDAGDKGIAGVDGLRGKITLEGSGAPGTGTNLATSTAALTSALSDAGLTVSDLQAGDLYVDTTNHRFYKKTSLGWSIRGVTFKGDTGATGSIGPQGLKGDTGAAGATGPQGTKGDGIDRYADSLATDVLLSSGIEKQLYYNDLITNIGSFLTETGSSATGSTFTIDTAGRYRIDVVFGFKAIYTTSTSTSVNYTAKLLVNDYVKKTASSTSSSISATTKYPSIELSWIGFLPATSTIKCKVSRDNSDSNVTLYANAIDKGDLTGTQEDTTITITKL